MGNSDFEKFAEVWEAAMETYGKTPTPRAVSMAFDVLADYDIRQVTQALTAHMRNPDSGQFFPKPADVIREIDGPRLKPDDIIAMANLANTPLGVLCRMHIGSWNLSNWNYVQLRPLAKECLSLIPEWQPRLERGQLTEMEKQTMQRFGVHADNKKRLNE